MDKMIEGLNGITAEEFGIGIAKALLESSSSTAFFFIQQALVNVGGIGDVAYVGWEDAERLLRRLLEKKT